MVYLDSKREMSTLEHEPQPQLSEFETHFDDLRNQLAVWKRTSDRFVHQLRDDVKEMYVI